jgi:hypothetical protein
VSAILFFNALIVVRSYATPSFDCPGGCVIASVLSPVRICECVVPRCDWRAAAGRVAGPMQRPPDPREALDLAVVQAGVDCSFCQKRKSFTYTSFEACYAADLAFKPLGRSIHKTGYASLRDSRGGRRGRVKDSAAASGPQIPAAAAAGDGPDYAASLAQQTDIAATAAAAASKGPSGADVATEVSTTAQQLDATVVPASVCPPPPSSPGCTVCATDQLYVSKLRFRF